jgi:hypothetical protein
LRASGEAAQREQPVPAGGLGVEPDGQPLAEVEQMAEELGEELLVEHAALATILVWSAGCW